MRTGQVDTRDQQAQPGLVQAVGAWMRVRIMVPPWGSGLGLARTVLALGTLATLLATPPQVLLSPLAGGVVPPVCSGMARASMWCVLPGGPEGARWASVVILAITASGWRPRITAIPHWWVAWSLITSVSIQDGGDQITAVLTLLLIPVLLTDRRRWHWQQSDPDASGPLSRLVAVAGLLMISVQVAGLYLDAGISKLGVSQWINGTAMFYFFRSPLFGAPPWLTPVVSAATSSGIGVAAVTWGAVILEITLGLALLLPARLRPVLLTAGLLFHDTIALTMGLVSFDCAMSAALLLYLLPVGTQLSPPRWWRWRRTGKIPMARPDTASAGNRVLARPAVPANGARE